MVNMKFDGEKLKDLRLKSNLKQTELAEAVGVGQDRISRYEKGEEPPFQVLVRLERFFGVQAEHLFYYAVK